jgi:CHAT domain-containing protein/Tfp pilus assembly protein PilF
MKAIGLFLLVISILFIRIPSSLAQPEVDSTMIKYTIKDTSIAQELFNEGKNLLKKGDYKNAKCKFDSVENMYLNIFGKNSLRMADLFDQKSKLKRINGNYIKSEYYIRRAIEIKSSQLETTDPQIAILYGNLANLYTTIEKYDSAIVYYKRAQNIFTDKFGQHYFKNAFIYVNMGAVYEKLAHYKKSESNYIAASKILQNKFGQHHIILSTLYNNLGIFYDDQGEYQKAVDYHLLALKSRINEFGEMHLDVASSYNNLGAVLCKQGKNEISEEYLKKAVKIRLEKLGNDHVDVATVYNNLGVLYKRQGRYSYALDYYEKALEIRESAAEFNQINLAASYNNLGTLNLLLNNIDQALIHHQSSLELKLRILEQHHPNLARSYYNLALAHFANKEYKTAINYCHVSLKSLQCFEENSCNCASFESAIDAFELLSDIYRNRFLETYDRSFLDSSVDAGVKALKIVNCQSKKIDTKYNFSWREKNFSIYEKNIRLSLLQREYSNINTFPKLAFLYAEKNRTKILQEKIQASNALHYANLPDSLLEKEYELRVDLTYYDKKRQEKLNEGLEETDTTVLSISSKLFDLQQAYDHLKARFESEYPDYYKLKYDLSTVSVEKVQTQVLEEGQAMLEYFVGDSSIFVFRLEKDRYEIREIKRDFPLREWVELLRQNISQRHTVNHERYAEVAHKLYEKLFAPVAEGLPKRLIIVPDGILGYIPFEALLTEAPENIYKAEHLPYLLRRHQISYSYSATLLREMQQKEHRQAPSREVLAIAPFADIDTVFTSHLDQSNWMASLRSDTLAALPYTKLELDSLAQIFPTDVFLGENATEANFVSQAGVYRILHLSTHGKADSRVGDYSYLAFYPQPDSLENELLYVRDLYNLSLNAELVTLSACETGTGELQRGEGIISLARAFAYAGAKSIATTLWQVNDRSTQQLMVAFYRYLKEGLPKDEALHRAKLDYLDSHSGSSAYPYFWAAVIGIGDMSSI